MNDQELETPEKVLNLLTDQMINLNGPTFRKLICNRYIHVSDLSNYSEISEHLDYEFLENLTDDRKRNQGRRRLREGFKFSNEQVSILIPNQRSGKNKIINLATSNNYQILDLTLQNSKETIRDLAQRILRDKLSIKDIRVEARALANSAPNANAATKFPDITKDANEIQRDRRKFVEAFERIDYPDHFTLESVKERLDKYDISTLPDLQALADVMIMLCIRPAKLTSLHITDARVAGYAKNQDYDLIPRHLRKLGAVYKAVVHEAQNPVHVMTIARECLRHNANNHSSPVQNYVVINTTIAKEIIKIRAEINNDLTAKINSRDANYATEAQNIITMINDVYEKYNEIKQVLETYHNNFNQIVNEFETIRRTIATLQDEINQRYPLGGNIKQATVKNFYNNTTRCSSSTLNDIALDPENFNLLSILKFRRTKDNFTLNKSVEHTLISKFISYVATTNGKWGKVASALSKNEISKVKKGISEGIGKELGNTSQNNHLNSSATRQARLWGLSPQAQRECVKSFWNDVELEQLEENTHISEKELDKIEAEQEIQATKNASGQMNIIQNRFITRSKKREHDLQVDEETSKRCKADAVNHNKLEEKIDKNEQDTINENEDNVIMEGTTIRYTDAAKEIFSIYKEKYPKGDLIDLRLNSPFFKTLPKSTKMAYLEEMDNKIESLVSKNVHDFLTQFFSKKLTAEEWHCEIDDLRSPEPNNDIMVALVRVIRRTLPQFIKAFALEDQNPLLNVATVEGAHLNSFVHPCIDAFLWYISNVHYEYGEITSKRHVNKNRADGAGYMVDADKFQLIYVEGSRPVSKDDKEITDLEKISNNLKNIFAEIVKDTVKKRRRLPSTLYVFGGLSFRLQIHLFYIDYNGTDDFEPNINLGTYRLNEVDNTNIPRKFSEISDFVYFYECVLKWALLIRDVTASFEIARAEQRPSRISFANALSELDCFY
ncbi:46108_t:CDS:10 [Gigaspora margarita]|uniref:46108_t:CDS:1 n=1 Tax=Gigaspora margarita TaxID=4874 RepID=A0ABN7UGX1_GIGMA|nr:46108_t:CDS:10 [Gigaspora margarita]